MNGIGNKEILYRFFFYNNKNNIKEIFINEISQTSIDYEYNLAQNLSNITIVWNNNLTSCEYMFYKLNDIIKIDFTHFISSSIWSICLLNVVHYRLLI